MIDRPDADGNTVAEAKSRKGHVVEVHQPERCQSRQTALWLDFISAVCPILCIVARCHREISANSEPLFADFWEVKDL